MEGSKSERIRKAVWDALDDMGEWVPQWTLVPGITHYLGEDWVPRNQAVSHALLQLWLRGSIEAKRGKWKGRTLVLFRVLPRYIP